MKIINRFFLGVVLGAVAGIGTVVLFAPDKRNEWFDEIHDKTQDILVEFNRAAKEYKEELENDLAARQAG